MDTNPTQRHAFRIPVGDWSGDGHGKCDYIDATAAKPIGDVREAYFAAKAKVPALIHPESFCEAYEDSSVPDDVAAALRAAGAPLPEDLEDGFGGDAMAAIVAWFINQGDPACDVRLDGNPPPMLPFYGCDEQNRHIGFIGYGLLGG